MFRVSTIAAAVLATASLAGAASAQTATQSPWAIGAHVGTTGIGAEIQYGASDLLVLRAGGDYGRIDRDLDSSNITYDGRAEWKTVNAAIDLHPFRNAFFVSGGVYAGDRKVKVNATPSASVLINGVPFTPAQLGRISGEAKLSDTSPFVGLGFDNTFHGAGRWGVRAMGGVAFSDTPDVALSASGPFGTDARVQTYLRQQEQEVRDDADAFKTYPVLSLGLNYRF